MEVAGELHAASRVGVRGSVSSARAFAPNSSFRPSSRTRRSKKSDVGAVTLAIHFGRDCCTERRWRLHTIAVLRCCGDAGMQAWIAVRSERNAALHRRADERAEPLGRKILGRLKASLFLQFRVTADFFRPSSHFVHQIPPLSNTSQAGVLRARKGDQSVMIKRAKPVGIAIVTKYALQSLFVVPRANVSPAQAEHEPARDEARAAEADRDEIGVGASAGEAVLRVVDECHGDRLAKLSRKHRREPEHGQCRG
ncbi:hypothetical protein L1887_58158 [Cichorium endivia]|nr:hypothetical protein L1887_58158 [Cichorium endivia]